MARKEKEEFLDLFYFVGKCISRCIFPYKTGLVYLGPTVQSRWQLLLESSTFGKQRISYSNQHNKEENKPSKKSKSNSKNQIKKSNKSKKEQKTKDGKFDFDEEIVIGLTRINSPTPPKKVDKKRAEKMAKKHKQKKQQQQVKKVKNVKEEIVISDIYSKQNKQEIQKETQGKKKKNQIKKAPKQLNKKQEMVKRKRKAVFRIIKWLTLLGIIIGGAIYALLSPIFNINNIKVEGNSKISTEEIISLSNIQTGQNMFRYKKREIVKNIKQNPYIESVQAQRKLPDEIELIVVERKATFIIPLGNANALINNQGYILEITSKKQTLPMLKGTSTQQEQIQPGSRLVVEDLEKLGDVLKIMESATSNGIAGAITQIDITNRNDYVLRLAGNKKTVHLGDISNLSTKMLWIITFNEKEGNTEGEIILNMNLNSTRPYFRKKV